MLACSSWVIIIDTFVRQQWAPIGCPRIYSGIDGHLPHFLRKDCPWFLSWSYGVHRNSRGNKIWRSARKRVNPNFMLWSNNFLQWLTMWFLIRLECCPLRWPILGMVIWNADEGWRGLLSSLHSLVTHQIDEAICVAALCRFCQISCKLSLLTNRVIV